MNLSQPPESDSRQAVPARQYEIVEHSAAGIRTRPDEVVVEEPVEIRVVFGPPEQRTMRSVSITMRTPGHDEELAAGFLLTENILSSAGQIDGFQLRGVAADGTATGNIIRVDLCPEVELEPGWLQRNFFTTSSCGVCGKASLEALQVKGLKPVTGDGFELAAEHIRQLPDRLRARQPTFDRTGGLHGAGLANAAGQLTDSREDVGRHNAVDKLIGRHFLDGHTPLLKYVMIVSGRVSFEIMQKALVAGIPMIIAVGAPSSLAIDMAIHYNMTLIGFTSARRFNVYAGADRVS